VNLIEEKIQEMIDDGIILIDSDGMVWVRSMASLSIIWGIICSVNLPNHRQNFLGEGGHYQYRKRSGYERSHP